jgi:hypothetical protein
VLLDSWLRLWAWIWQYTGSPPLSRHYRLLQQDNGGTVANSPNVVVVADGAQSAAGPFAFTTDLYAFGGDLLAMANGRESVTNGVPLTLNFVLYAVDTSQDATPLEGA